MSVNVPFTNSILDISSGNNSIVYVPAFPGAYFYNAYPANANGWFIPIYTSISNFSHNGFLPLFNDVDKQVTVLPGYTLEMYSDFSYIPVSPAYTIDNSAGTDIKVSVIPTINTGSSCKLYYTPASTGIKSELTYKFNPVLISNGNYSYLSYGGSDYVVFSFTSGTGAIINNVRDVSAELLVVAGGGAGGYSAFAEGSGGGGAGGVAIGKLHISKNVTYICTVGNGAQPNNTQAVFNGGDSTITNPSSQTLTVKGGGGGASGFDGNTNGGQNGGSGGGSTAAWAKQNLWGAKIDATNTLPGTTLTPYGSRGGQSTGSWGSNVAGGGGGGGAGGTLVGPGNVTISGSPGYGGNGIQWTINGAFYGGGGAGGAGSAHNHFGLGGTGGGGNQGADGAANTGGGGGGQRSGVSGRGKGGSGIIIIAIKMSDLN